MMFRTSTGRERRGILLCLGSEYVVKGRGENMRHKPIGLLEKWMSGEAETCGTIRLKTCLTCMLESIQIFYSLIGC